MNKKRILVFLLIQVFLLQTFHLSSQTKGRSFRNLKSDEDTTFTLQERKDFKYDEWKFSSPRALLEFKREDFKDLGKFDTYRMKLFDRQIELNFINDVEDLTSIHTAGYIYLYRTREEMEKKILQYLRPTRTSLFKYHLIEGFGDMALGLNNRCFIFARGNFVVQMQGGDKAPVLAKIIDKRIQESPILQNEKDDVRFIVEEIEDDPKVIKRINERYERRLRRDMIKRKINQFLGIDIL